MGEVLYEERVYPAGYWACVTRKEDLYEQSISMAFMKLMRFICKENSAGQALPLVLAPPTLSVHLFYPLPLSLHTYYSSCDSLNTYIRPHSFCTPVVAPATHSVKLL